LIEIVNKIIIVPPSRLFILLYQWCTVTQTSNTVKPFQNSESYFARSAGAFHRSGLKVPGRCRWAHRSRQVFLTP